MHNRILAVLLFICGLLADLGFCGNLGVGAREVTALFGDVDLHDGVGPADCVLEDLTDLGNVVGALGLVTGLEVEDLAEAAGPGAAGAEDFAACEPADEDQIIGLGNVEVLAVHLFLGQFEGSGDALGDGMGGAGAPYARTVALAPLQTAGAAQDVLHGLGGMCGVLSSSAFLSASISGVPSAKTGRTVTLWPIFSTSS